MFGAVFISGTKHSHVPVLFLFSGPKIHVAPINVKFGTGERIKGPLPHAKFHVYRGRNVGMQLPKLKILAINLCLRGDLFALFLQNYQLLYASIGSF